MKKVLYSFLTVFIILLILNPLIAEAQEQTKPEEKEAGTPTEQGEAEEEKADRSSSSIMELLQRAITGSFGEPINMMGVSQETSGDWTTIKENAEIIYGNATILADLITFNRVSRDVRAEGNVVLIQPDLRVGGDEISFNLRELKGSITNPLVETKDGFVLSGTKLEKYDVDRYRINGASLTTCTQPSPNWLLKASSIDFKVGQRATLRNARFNLYKVPVFYTPWMQLPMNKERASGFLMPIWGTSDFHGRYINTAYFWAINRSHDATVGLDYYEKRGWRYSGEYRNNRGNNNFTSSYIYFINDATVERNRYDARFNVRQSLPLGIVAGSDMQFLSDREYKRDFINRNIWYSPIFRKTAYVSKTLGLLSLSAAYNDINRFVSRNRISEIRYLPTIDARSREQQLFSLPVYVSFFVNYTRPSIIDVRRQTDKDPFKPKKTDTYQRLDAQGTIKSPIKTFSPWLTFTPSFSVRDTRYSSRYNPKKEKIVDVPITRRYYDVEFEMTGPVVSRIFGRQELYATRYKHIIEPRITYRWRSEISKATQNRIILIDHVDNYYKVHELRWSLDNRILRKRTSARNPQGEVVEMLKVGLSQYVTMDDKLQTSYNKAFLFDPTALEVSGRFSPLEIYTTARISNVLSASARLEYSISARNLVSYTISSMARWRSINYYFGWYKTLKQFIDFAYFRPATNRLVTNGRISFLDGRLSFTGAFDYDFIRKRILNYLIGGSVNSQCLGLTVDARSLNILGKQDFQFRFGITIGGLRSLLGSQYD